MLTFVVHGVVSKVDVVHWKYDLQCADLSSSKNIIQKSLQCSKSILGKWIRGGICIGYLLKEKKVYEHGWTVNNGQVIKS